MNADSDLVVKLNVQIGIFPKWIIGVLVPIFILALLGTIAAIFLVQNLLPGVWLVISLLLAVSGVVLATWPKFLLGRRVAKASSKGNNYRFDQAKFDALNAQSKKAVTTPFEIRDGVPIIWTGPEIGGVMLAAVALFAAILSFEFINAPVQHCVSGEYGTVCAVAQKQEDPNS